MAASAGISMEKLQSGPAWNRIREEFYATGDAAAVQNQLTGVIDTLSIEAFDGTLREKEGDKAKFARLAAATVEVAVGAEV